MTPITMTPYIAPLLLGAVFFIAAPAPAGADTSLQITDYSDAKKERRATRPHVRPSARRAYGYQAPRPFGFGYRNDPSFDPSGRPWRPNFYATCYEDLGYGRFRDCSIP